MVKTSVFLVVLYRVVTYWGYSSARACKVAFSVRGLLPQPMGGRSLSRPVAVALLPISARMSFAVLSLSRSGWNVAVSLESSCIMPAM